MPSSYQYNLALIQHEVNNAVIEQRSRDGYINASQLCAVAGKKWHQYVSQEPTGHFMRALSAKTGIEVPELVQTVATPGSSSVWVHPKLALHLAQWLSAEFAVQVTEWVHDWLSGNKVPASAYIPYHLKRYLANAPAVPIGYFSALQVTVLDLIGPLQETGFEIPPNWMPDISIGKTFCEYLRKHHGVDTKALPSYRHEYEDGRVVYPKAYPEEMWPWFKKWFREVWLPEYGVAYFKRKSPTALEYLDKIPMLSAPRTPPRLGAPR